MCFLLEVRPAQAAPSPAANGKGGAGRGSARWAPGPVSRAHAVVLTPARVCPVHTSALLTSVQALRCQLATDSAPVLRDVNAAFGF